jgi:polyphosphate glucokinase
MTETKSETGADNQFGELAEIAPPEDQRLTLAIDIGGTRLKAAVLDRNGGMVAERVRVRTPRPCPPELMVSTLAEMVAPLPAFDRVSVGFPGVVRKGRILTAVNLGNSSWQGFNLEQALSAVLEKPVRVINDADMQGLAAIGGDGVEMVITLGTGVGCGLFLDGRLAPHLEIGHIPFRKNQTFEEQLGNNAFLEAGRRRWNRRLIKAIDLWRVLTNFDKLYLGGGNSREITFELPEGVEVVSNELGLKGGIGLWR